ncbi:hypothetical protein KKF84_09065 [Myxococcota bacterium]|nr:hypothetical protein [Myxococcota bacterium]
MAYRLTPEQSARNLIQLAVDSFKKEPGETLPIMSLASEWDDNQTDTEAFGEGIDFALQNGWITVESTNSLPLYTLTRAGYQRR